MRIVWCFLMMLCGSAWLVGPLSAGEEWPQFRGPNGNGHADAKNVPTHWNKTLNIIWKQPIPGLGWSTPIIHKGRIYLTTAVPVGGEGPTADQSLRALCLDAKTGKEIWSQEVFQQSAADAPKIHNKNSHASPTAVVHEGKVFVHFGHQGTACLDLNGTIVWKNRDFKYPPVHGNGGAPAVVNDLLFFSCDGASSPYVVAVEQATGKLRWKKERSVDADKKFSFSTPLILTVAGKQQIISPASDATIAYDPATGEEIWKITYSGFSVVPQPVFGHGLVYLSTGFMNASLIAVKPDGQGDVTESHIAWQLNKGVSKTPSFVLIGDELYFISDQGVATCVDAKTGSVHWTQRLSGDTSASPIYADGKIYSVSEKGVCTVWRPGKVFEKIAENDLAEKALASPAAIDGALFIRTDKHLYRIGN